MVTMYGERVLGALVAGEWELLEGLGARVDSGVGVIATRGELPDPTWKHPYEVALPFPFTLEQFQAFCAWHPTFEWEAVESQFTNDDGTLDEDALNELAERGAEAAELVRRFLAGDSDHSPSQPQAAQQDAPVGKGVWVQSKLSEDDKAEILRLYNRGRGAKVFALAVRFGVSRPTIDRVLKKAGIKV
jgi:hypothetical protein